MSVHTKMTAIADEVRELSGVTGALGLDAMASNLGDANDEVANQSDLIADIIVALEGKAAGGVPVLQEKTVTPTKSQQGVIPDSGYDGLSQVIVDAIPAEYIVPSGSVDIASNGEYDVREAESVNVNVPAPEPSLQSKTVSPATTAQTVTPDNGYDGLEQVTVNAMPTATQATPSITVSADGKITATATQSAGYVASGTQTATKQMIVQAAQIITPGTTDQTIASGRYLTGTQTIEGDSNLVADNIKSGVAIFGVSGNYEGRIEAAQAVIPKEVNFFDYDGTCLYAYTVDEAQALTALPVLPQHDGLVCQGWNWSLEGVQGLTRAMNIGAMYITDDGTTRLYITLQEGRTSPMLGVAVNGTVTVDWGDDTTPDTLTGTSVSTVVWTPTHDYATPGDYVIRLTVSGNMSFIGVNSANQRSCILRHASTADVRNQLYQNALTRVEIGDGVQATGLQAFQFCHCLRHVTIPEGVTALSGNTFNTCQSLEFAVIPHGVTMVGNTSFNSCSALIGASLPESATSIGTNNPFYGCSSLRYLALPDDVTTIPSSSFNMCKSLPNLYIPDSVTTIAAHAFNTCYNLTSLAIPPSVTTINASTFNVCYGVAYYDFTRHTAVPTLANTNAFTGIPADCEIRVPAALYDTWIAATNWATYADYIVSV